MAKPIQLTHTKGEVRRAGELFRRYVEDGGEEPAEDEVAHALAVALDFRACHSHPLTKVANALRYTVRAKTPDDVTPQVTQRLKRFPTILDKLVREPGLDLSRMQDIGGCRAVLPDIATCHAVHRQLRKRPGFDREKNYIEHPKPTGYRGIHVILKHDERHIEVQLRTPTMHEWAIAVERLGFRLGHELKTGAGATEVRDWLAIVSKAMALEETHDEVPPEMLQQIEAARHAALPFLQ